MANGFTVGCKVRSPFGEGTVTQVGDQKVVLSLDSAPQLRLEYSKDKLELLQVPGGAQQQSPSQPAQERARDLSASSAPAPSAQTPETVPDFPGLRAIESLRFGLVPVSDLENLTLGYENAKAWILGRLPSRKGDRIVSQVNGAFGTGKSHMMALIRHIAMQEGYAVAQVEVDGSQVSLSQPATLLAKLYLSLRASDLPPTNPLLNLYLKSIQKGMRSWDLSKVGLHRAEGNLGIVRFLHDNGELDMFEEALDAFLGGSAQYTASQLMRDIRSASRYYLPCTLYAVIGRDVDGRPRDFIESIVATTLIAAYAGYKGLIITIDEFEVEYNLPWGYLDRTRMLVEALYSYMQRGSEWPKAPLGLFFAAVGQEGHQGDEIIEKMMTLFDGECFWSLKSWSKGARQDLAKRIYGIYSQTYSIEKGFRLEWFEQADRQCRGDEQNIRAFIKRFVARLDEEFGPPTW